MGVKGVDLILFNRFLVF